MVSLTLNMSLNAKNLPKIVFYLLVASPYVSKWSYPKFASKYWGNLSKLINLYSP